MQRIKNFGVLLWILIAISCSIVKDSDITSLDQFNKLVLKSFEIDQNAGSGNSSTLAVLKYDSVQNFISKISGYHIARLRGFSLAALGTRKMLLKSGVNTTTEIKIYYRDDGLPHLFWILAGDSLVESYRFWYNSNKQLVKLVTDIDPIDSKPETIHYKDSIYYPASGVSVYPSSIKRISSYDASKAGTFTPEFCTGCSGSAASTLNAMSFVSQSNTQLNYRLGFNNGNCNDNNNQDNYSCGGVNNVGSNGGSTGNNNQSQLSYQSNITFNRTLTTSITSQSPSDTYYFHPIMILRDAIPQGGLYFWFYSIDWYHISGGTYVNDDLVKIKFNYAQ